MNITIKTLELKTETKTVPLTKAIINQLPQLEHKYTINELFENGTCKVLGEVSIGPDTQWIIVTCPEGPRRLDPYHKASLGPILHRIGQGRIERIIVLK